MLHYRDCYLKWILIIIVVLRKSVAMIWRMRRHHRLYV